MNNDFKLKMKHIYNKYLNYGLAPFATAVTMIAGIANEGMTNFLFAAPSVIVAVLILIDKDKTEHKISKRIIVIGFILATYVGISRFQGGKLFYPANGEELTAITLLCFYPDGIENGKTNL